MLVIPAYRESERLPPFLESLCSAVEAAKLPVTIRTVDDGSGETESATLRDTVERMRSRHPSLDEPLLLPANRGKGGAVYAGWDSVDGDGFDWLAFVDADGAVSAPETVRVLSAANATDPIDNVSLFAVRVHEAGTEVHRKLLRKILGDTFRLLVKITFRLPLRDTQCGCKIVPSHCYQNVRPFLSEHRFVFDVELAARLIRRGYTIREIPISWDESPGGHLGLRSAARMLTALLGIRWRLTTKR